MYTLYSLCKDRYFSSSGRDNSLKEQTASLTANERTTLADRVAHQLAAADSNDANHVLSMEEELTQIELELQQAEERLEKAKEKEDFLATRINKYQKLLLHAEGKEVEETQEETQEVADDEDEEDVEKDVEDYEYKSEEEEPPQPALVVEEQAQPQVERTAEQEEHHQASLKKQEQLKEALGQIMDVHLTMRKNIKLITRDVEELEQKKYILTKQIQEYKDFVVSAEEQATNEESLQLHENNHNDALHAVETGQGATTMEMAPLTTAVTNEESRQSSSQHSSHVDGGEEGVKDKQQKDEEEVRIPTSDNNVDLEGAATTPKEEDVVQLNPPSVEEELVNVASSNK